MQMKKILATVAAAALAVSAMTVSAFAAITNENGSLDPDSAQPGKYIYYAATDLGDKAADCYGVSIAITADAAIFAENGLGGGIACTQTDRAFAWTEFGNADAAKAITTDGVTIDITSETPLWDGENAQVILEGWWGADFECGAITYLDKDGNDLLAAGAADEATDGAAGDTDAAGAADKGNADTGVEGVAAVAGLAIVAAGAIVVAKKRK